MIDVSQIIDISNNNIRVEIENCINSLKRINMEVLMIDVSHDELEIPALYTIVPGAHFRERSMIGDVGLFCAKLLNELVSDGQLLERKLSHMEALLPGAYYLEFYRGRNLAEMGYLEDAVNHFTKALTLDPEAEDLPYIYSYMGSCLKDLERYQDAIEVLLKGLAEDEQRPDIHNSLGVCFFKEGNYPMAIVHFQRAVELNPASAIDYANLGVNYHRTGDIDKAVEYLTVAVTLEPGLEFARDLLTELLEP